MSAFKKPPPLDITCTSTDCDNDLHCFKARRKMVPEDHGKCRTCGADLIDWPRVHRRNLRDAPHTFEALQHELVRHHFFHQPIDEVALNHARRKGRVRLREAVQNRLAKYLAPAEPPRDGRQTGMSGNVIFYAQHATATCCRTCLSYWHAIPKGRPLTAEEVDYCARLIDLYVGMRLPQLKEESEKVPPRRRGALPDEGFIQP